MKIEIKKMMRNEQDYRHRMNRVNKSIVNKSRVIKMPKRINAECKKRTLISQIIIRL